MVTIVVIFLARAPAGLATPAPPGDRRIGLDRRLEPGIPLSQRRREWGPVPSPSWAGRSACTSSVSAVSRPRGVGHVRTPATATPTWASLWLPYAPVPFAIVLGAREMSTGAEPTDTRRRARPDHRRVRPPIPAARRQPPVARHRRRHRPARPADRIGQPRAVHRSTDTRHATPRTQRRRRLRAAGRPRRLQVGERHPRSPRRGRAAAQRGRAHRSKASAPGTRVARIGGDEFAILVEDAPEIADQIADRIVRAFDEPFVVAGRTIHMRLSIGLATAVAGADVSAEELFKRADLAMYSAKRAHVGSRQLHPRHGARCHRVDPAQPAGENRSANRRRAHPVPRRPSPGDRRTRTRSGLSAEVQLDDGIGGRRRGSDPLAASAIRTPRTRRLPPAGPRERIDGGRDRPRARSEP